jgi:hypothetical protein
MRDTRDADRPNDLFVLPVSLVAHFSPVVLMLRLAGAKNPVLYFVSRHLSAGLDERKIGTVHA